MFLPGFVLIERRVQLADARPVDLQQPAVLGGVGRRLLNGLARFALMFVFVFYFQGVQGDSPILAGIKLAPLAIGMLISSPLAGIWADRRGSRALAVAGDAGHGRSGWR